MIGIIDYGLGNIHAIVNIYKKLNLDAILSLLRATIEAIPPESVSQQDRARYHDMAD